jgi:hypothetical protein
VTDNEFIAEVLADGKWHSTSEILSYSIHERGHGLTVHSRVSDLRSKGFEIEHRTAKGSRAQAHQYRLVRARPGQDRQGKGLDNGSALDGLSPTAGSAEQTEPARQPSLFDGVAA